MIILFTLTMVDTIGCQLDCNPYQVVGLLHSDGLDYVGSQISSLIPANSSFIQASPTTFLSQQIANYISGTSLGITFTSYQASNYDPSLSPPLQAYPINPIAQRAALVALYNYEDDLANIDLDGKYNTHVQKVYSFVEYFYNKYLFETYGPLTAATSVQILSSSGTPTLPVSSPTMTVTDAWQNELSLLFGKISHPSASNERNVLAWIGHAVLASSYYYWFNVYNNSALQTGDVPTWLSVINTMDTALDTINWAVVMEQDVKGALLGAVAGQKDNLIQSLSGNKDNAVITGAAIGAVSASSTGLMVVVGLSSMEPAMIESLEEAIQA